MKYISILSKKLVCIIIIVISIQTNIKAQFSIWGVTNQGGSYNVGVMFKYLPSSNTLTKLFDFCDLYYDSIQHQNLYDTTGCLPRGLLLANNGNLYGITSWGGSCFYQTSEAYGELFKYNPINGNFSNLMVFGQICSSTADHPQSTIIQAKNGLIYGTQSMGGSCGAGGFFSYNIDSAHYTVLHIFGCIPENFGGPVSNVYQALDGNLYGLLPPTLVGQNEIFKYNPDSNIYRKILYNSNVGSITYGSFIEGDTGKLYTLASRGGLYNYGSIIMYDYIHGSFTKVHDFDSINDGSYPITTMIKASDGYLYGAAPYGGFYNKGTFFRFNTQTDSLTKLFDFDGPNKGWGSCSLLQAPVGLIYGIVGSGGIYNKGVLFSFNILNNAFTKLFDFDSIHGTTPMYFIIVPDSITTITKIYNENNNFKIFPNPAGDNITIETPCKATIEISNIQGQLIKTLAAGGTKTNVDVSALPCGVYVLRVKTEKGLAVRKFVKE